MPAQPRQVVAIFGANTPTLEVSDAARGAATSVVAAGGIVLSGGDGTRHDGVKDVAIDAVREIGSWIGVRNSSDGDPSWFPDGKGIVLEPKIGHQRNLLEAWLCDAAVVFEGGLGTVSECVSALCLDRPVLLVGKVWRDKTPPREYPDLHELFERGQLSKEQRADLTAQARSRLDEDRGAMAHLVRADVTADRLTLTELSDHIRVDEATQRVRTWLDDATGVPRGEFPDIDSFKELGKAYWICRRSPPPAHV